MATTEIECLPQKTFLFVPYGYSLLEEKSQSWIPIQNLLSPRCWTGEEFVDVTVEEEGISSEITHYAQVDAITTLGIDHNVIGRLEIDYHWMPPWVTQNQTPVLSKKCQCSEEDYAILALSDFLTTKPDKSDDTYRIHNLPSSRFDRLRDMGIIKDLAGRQCHGGRYTRLRMAKPSHVCESASTKDERNHALAYITHHMWRSRTGISSCPLGHFVD